MKSDNKPNPKPTRHIPDFEVIKICVHAYIADMKGIYNELERYQERFESLTEPFQGVNYADMLGIMTSTKGERQTLRIEALESVCECIGSIEDEYYDFSALVDSLEFGSYIWQHYFLGMSWNVVALRDHVDRATVWRRVRSTLTELYTIMPEQYRRYSIPNAQPKNF